MLNFDKLPTDKPNQNNIEAGRFTAIIFKTQMVDSKTTPGTQYLNVSFKIDNGGFVNENYFDSDKPFLLYKLGRLLKACNVELNGEGSLKDVAKVIQGKKVIIDVVVNDKGYGALDYSGNNEGIYNINETNVTTEDDLGQSVTIDPEIDQAIEADIDSNEDF